MLDKTNYSSWESRMLLYIKGKEHGKLLVDLVLNEPFQYRTLVVLGKENTLAMVREQTYTDLTDDEKICESVDIKATNIVLQGLPQDIYNLVNHNEHVKQIWDRVKLLIQGLVVPSFNPSDDPIASLNKAMAFLSTTFSSRFPQTNNQLRTSSNPRNQATIQDGRVTVQIVQGRQTQGVFNCYNYQEEGHIARQCTKPKRPKNSAWFKKKMLLTEALESGAYLDPDHLAFLADNWDTIILAQASHEIPTPAAFQTDAFDSDCDDAPTTKAVRMANLSFYDSNVI
ncbi:retrovirus-related pol polyprotein from transposon TNT 1-94 [Tanacetum coccineum]|uniref:Retrovirus-related pol polyprotein from transposon TNT 1-94 n=1 Tax=Tanacetum coccineum TaxID=301880 RepID=A0ABQ4X9C5_9ASTR